MGALLFLRFNHNYQNISTGGVVFNDVLVVQIVAGVCPQLRSTLIQVTDFEVLLVIQTETEAKKCNQQRNRCHTGVRKIGHDPPLAILLFTTILDVLDAPFGDPNVGHDQRMQNQVGYDNDRNTNTGRYGQITNDINLDEQQRQEAKRIRNQRQHARDIKRPECQARRRHRIKALGGLGCHGINNLHPMTDADREHQERHQNRVRIQPITQQTQNTQLPEHRHNRGQNRHERAGNAARVPEQQQRRQNNGNARKPGDGTDTLNQITDFFGEADNVDLDVGVFVLVLLTHLLLKQF